MAGIYLKVGAYISYSMPYMVSVMCTSGYRVSWYVFMRVLVLVLLLVWPHPWMLSLHPYLQMVLNKVSCS